MSPVGSGWDVPKDVRPWSRFHWFRVSPRAALVLVVLSERPVWYVGHYVDGRMWPCQAPECSMCGDDVGTQVRWVLAVAEATSHRTGLIELSDALGLEIRDRCRRNGLLRGIVIELSKHSHSVRSRTEMVFDSVSVGGWWKDLAVPDPEVALELTWKSLRAPRPKGRA